MPDVQELLAGLRHTLQFNMDAISREIAEYESIPKPTKLDALRAKAMGFYYSGSYDQAQPMMNALVSLEPNERNLLKLSKIHLRLGNYGEARDICDRVSQTFPDSAEAVETLVATHVEEGSFQEAEDACHQGLKSHPENERLRALLILSQHALSKPQDAAGLPRLMNSLANLTLRNQIKTTALTDPDAILERLSNVSAAQMMVRSEMMR